MPKIIKRIRKRRKRIQKRLRPITKAAIKALKPIIRKAIKESLKYYIDKEIKRLQLH